MKNHCCFLLCLFLVSAARLIAQPQPIISECPTVNQGAFSLSNATFLTEKDADSVIPIDISAGSEVVISLTGSQTSSLVYCSGQGSEWGDFWTYLENNNILNFKNLTVNQTGGLADSSFSKTKMLSYDFLFETSQTGVTTLVFHKYHFSNSTLRNVDGSSPWKDPVKEIHFNIRIGAQ